MFDPKITSGPWALDYMIGKMGDPKFSKIMINGHEVYQFKGKLWAECCFVEVNGEYKLELKQGDNNV